MSEVENDSMLETAARPDEDGDDGENDDEGDGDGEDEDEESAPAEAPPQSVTPEELEKRFKQAERAVAAYVKKIQSIFEDQAGDLVECPLCPPIHKGFLNLHDAGRVPDEIVQAVKLFLGIGTEVAYPPSQKHSACPVCDGLGKVNSGSRVAQWESLTCENCNGFGFIPPPGQATNGRAAGAAAEVLVAPEGEAFSYDDIDPSGEPRLLPDGRPNPNYGKWPQFKVSVPPWGVTAGLTALDASFGAPAEG